MKSEGVGGCDAGAEPLLEGPAGNRYVGRLAYMGSELSAGRTGGAKAAGGSCMVGKARVSVE